MAVKKVLRSAIKSRYAYLCDTPSKKSVAFSDNCEVRFYEPENGVGHLKAAECRPRKKICGRASRPAVARKLQYMRSCGEVTTADVQIGEVITGTVQSACIKPVEPTAVIITVVPADDADDADDTSKSSNVFRRLARAFRCVKRASH